MNDTISKLRSDADTQCTSLAFHARDTLMPEEDFGDLDALEFMYVADDCTIHGQPIVVVQGKQLVLYPGLDYERLYRLPSYVRENLSHFCILHCNWSLWSVLLTICPYTMSSGFWGKVEYLSRIEYLEDILKGTLALPQYVLDHDKLLEEQPLADYGLYASKEQMVMSGEPGNPQTAYH